MGRIQFETPMGEVVTKRAFWLAWNACGNCFGRGFLQDNPNATENDVWHNICTAGDYPGRQNEKPGEAYGDYVFGRMMKLVIHYGQDWVEISDNTPRSDYQAWCRKYPTYQSLIDAAIDDLKKPVSVSGEEKA